MLSKLGTLLLLIFNLGVFALMIGAAFTLKWAGYEFIYGTMFGFLAFAGWYRMKHGRWP